MRTLVIGGAGYIGSHVSRELLDHGHDVTVGDNLSAGLRQNLQPDGRFIHLDIMRPDQLRDAMDGIDAVVHLAALKAAGESMTKPEAYAQNNIAGTINILNAMTEAGVKRLIFSSSAAVYGEPVKLPVDEDHPTNPTNFYGFTKLEIERLMHWYDSLRGVRFAALRYFNAAGYDPKRRVRGLERSPANLLPVIMEVALGRRERLTIFGDDFDTPDGTGVRDYVHVSDLAAAHRLSLEQIDRTDSSLTVNLGSGDGLSVKQVLDASRRITGQAIPADIVGRRAGDPARLVASSQRAVSELGWKPVNSDLETLVQTSWDAYRSAADE